MSDSDKPARNPEPFLPPAMIAVFVVIGAALLYALVAYCPTCHTGEGDTQALRNGVHQETKS